MNENKSMNAGTLAMIQGDKPKFAISPRTEKAILLFQKSGELFDSMLDVYSELYHTADPETDLAANSFLVDFEKASCVQIDTMTTLITRLVSASIALSIQEQRTISNI